METKGPPQGIQSWIYILEEGEGRIWVRRFVLLLIGFIVSAVMHLDGPKNFVAAEAMEQAHLARNISEGRGYTTQSLNPSSLRLLIERYKSPAFPWSLKKPERLVLEQPRADITHPPLYPVAVAGLFKVLPKFIVRGVESSPQSRPPAEIAIGVFNFIGFLGVAFVLCHVGSKWFGESVGLLAALIFASSLLNWQFVFSGLPMLWLSLILILAASLALSIEERLREGFDSKRFGLMLPSAGLGTLIGAAFLTSYAAGLLLIPFALCLVVWSGGQRLRRLLLPMLTAFLLISAPWVARTWYQSGLPLGTATLAPLSDTLSFPGNHLELSQSPELSGRLFKEPLVKMIINIEEILRTEVPRLGGTWFITFFLVGLMLPMQDIRLNRFRWLLLAVFFTLILGQGLFKTQWSKISPGINSENLLAWFAPLALLYAAITFRRALEVFQFPSDLTKAWTQMVALFLCSLPLLVSALPPRMPVMSSPPYYLPAIRQLCSYLPEDSLMMTDMPWATAWYGRRDSLQITLRAGDDPKESFYRIHDYVRPFNALFLTPLTCDVPWRSEILVSSDAVWGRFYMDFLLRRESIPTGFPLKYAFGDGFPAAGYLFMADRPYWRDVKP